MEVDSFIIYVDRLEDGAIEAIDLSLPSDFLEVNEAELSYQSPVLIKGEAYIAEDELIMCFDIKAVANMHCTLCNEIVEVTIDIKKAYFAEPIKKMKSGLFNFKELVRGAIILETPNFVKCGGEECKHKAQFVKYLKSDDAKAKENEGKEYRPFADLNFEEEKNID